MCVLRPFRLWLWSETLFRHLPKRTFTAYWWGPMLQTLIRAAHHTKRHMPFAFAMMKVVVPRPVRKRLYRRYFEREINQNASVQTIFENIYNRNWWQSGESRSGTGSELAQTEEFGRALEVWLVRYAPEVSTILDAPC